VRLEPGTRGRLVRGGRVVLEGGHTEITTERDGLLDRDARVAIEGGKIEIVAVVGDVRGTRRGGPVGRVTHPCKADVGGSRLHPVQVVRAARLKIKRDPGTIMRFALTCTVTGVTRAPY